MKYSPVQAAWEGACRGECAASPDPAQAGSAFTPTDVGAVYAFFTGVKNAR